MLSRDFFHSTWLKLLAVLIAALLWLFVETETGLKSVDVELEYANVPRELVLLPGNPDSVRSLLRGPESLLPRLRDRSIRATVDLRGQTIGENELLISPGDVLVPYWAEVERVEPQQITVRLDNLLRKSVAVLPKLTGKVAEGFYFKNYVVTPQKVNISGPATIIEGISGVWSAPVDIEGISESFGQALDVKADRAGMSIESPEEFLVQVVIAPETTQRYFKDVPVVADQELYAVVFSQDRLEVLVGGARLAVEQLVDGQLTAVVALNGLTPQDEDYALKPTIRIDPPLADGGQLEFAIYPPEIRVRVQQREDPPEITGNID